MSKQYLIVVDYINAQIVQALATLRYDKAWAKLEAVVITRNPQKARALRQRLAVIVPIHVVPCEFASDVEIKDALKPYAKQTAGVICRTDKHIQDLRRTVPLLPEQVHVASVTALTTATNKRLMREAFQAHVPELTPMHMQVQDYTPATLAAIEKRFQYPLIVKPANLAASLLVQAVASHTELESALQKIFTQVASIYTQEERHDQPEVIVEEYLEGDFYSIDAYTLKANEVYACPPVLYITAKQRGVDDFSCIKRSLPTTLTTAQIAEAQKVAKAAIQAVGLTYSSVHVELVLTVHGWKIIELGPRLGNFRHDMYNLVYGIEHTLNDIKIHLGLKPEIPTTAKAYCVTYSIYPRQEGILKRIWGLEAIISNPACYWHKILAHTGDETKFAKHGGHALAEFMITTGDETSLKALEKKIEKEVYAEID